MSKNKTRKQKIEAELRNLKNQIKVKQESTSPSETFKISLPKSSHPSRTLSSQDYSYIFKDLRKIMIVASILIALEILLSLTTQNESAKLVLRSIGFKF